MSYLITITTASGSHSYVGIGNRDALMDAAYDEHGACGVTMLALAKKA